MPSIHLRIGFLCGDMSLLEGTAECAWVYIAVYRCVGISENRCVEMAEHVWRWQNLCEDGRLCAGK